MHNHRTRFLNTEARHHRFRLAHMRARDRAVGLPNRGRMSTAMRGAWEDARDSARARDYTRAIRRSPDTGRWVREGDHRPIPVTTQRVIHQYMIGNRYERAFGRMRHGEVQRVRRYDVYPNTVRQVLEGDDATHPPQ